MFDEQRLDSRGWTHDRVSRWCVIERCAWNLYNFVNRCHPNKTSKNGEKYLQVSKKVAFAVIKPVVLQPDCTGKLLRKEILGPCAQRFWLGWWVGPGQLQVLNVTQVICRQLCWRGPASAASPMDSFFKRANSVTQITNHKDSENRGKCPHNLWEQIFWEATVMHG